ncbi:sigma-54-dependent transcriptional regulator [Limibacterium fermenti]|uniref:sigma-54-dependent transcriptional regulator n=1 Tax=Limibacterium fermenti TaxID=3229863 RepID=UPI000E896100|nr:sigma-54-dependent Fis family transcriptional regulator [Porphyromonadaceae bacterium]HBX46085.1 sigma-54-dependent Fis family transcriptional regulator [Porphyromonadaceae bacterium]
MDKHGKILIIDDNEDILFALNLLLQPYVEKVKVTTQPERIEYFMASFHPDVILLDMNFHKDASSGEEGFVWLKRIREIDPQAIVIFITAYADTEKAVRAIKEGATDFIPKPWEKDKLLATVSSAISLRKSHNEVNQLKQQVAALESNRPPLPEIIGESESMQKLFHEMDRLKDTDANILILGENGTGKDLIANFLYYSSPRVNKPFVHIDLGSIPEQLFESELFGYEKGAFTDAKKDKPGRFEIASGGTLFLDEIGNLTPTMQAKLLTALEKKQIIRLGATRPIRIDVRLICATNADIHSQAAQGDFRQDLLYRINTVQLHVPPLRERGNDILLLADHFLHLYARKYKKEIKNIAPSAQRKLKEYAWQGNVRELQHAIERAVILSGAYTLTADDFMLVPVQGPGKKKTDNLNLEELERSAIEQALKVSGGNMSQAADLLGISRFSLYRKIEKHTT